MLEQFLDNSNFDEFLRESNHPLASLPASMTVSTIAQSQLDGQQQPSKVGAAVAYSRKDAGFGLL